jgi:MinD-like ATPase involved in chromosome partitioning or flagellar assembly
MALVAVTYVKGRAGATTTAVGLAVMAPAASRPVVVECDPAGGDLIRRHRLAARPTVVDLAAAARGLVVGTSAAFAVAVQEVRIGDRSVDVVVAPAGGAQTRAALPELTRRTLLNPPDRLVVADCGRLEPWSPVRPLLAAADVVVVLACARADELDHVREHLADLVDLVTGRLMVLLTAGGPYQAAEVADVMARHVADELARQPDRLTVAGPLPDDRRAARVLGGELMAGRRWQRLPLMAALDRLTGELAPLLLTAPWPEVGSGTEVGR